MTDMLALLVIVVSVVFLLMAWASRKVGSRPPELRPWAPRQMLRMTAAFAAATTVVTALEWRTQDSPDWIQLFYRVLGILAGIGVISIWGALWEIRASCAHRPVAGGSCGEEEDAGDGQGRE